MFTQLFKSEGIRQEIFSFSFVFLVGNFQHLEILCCVIRRVDVGTRNSTLDARKCCTFFVVNEWTNAYGTNFFLCVSRSNQSIINNFFVQRIYFPYWCIILQRKRGALPSFTPR